MSFECTCPECKIKLHFDDADNGRQIECPRCSTLLIVSADRKIAAVNNNTVQRCSNCNAFLNEEDRFCQFCGTKVADSQAEKKCIKCGKKLAPDSVFCSMCGTLQNSNTVSGFNNQNVPQFNNNPPHGIYNNILQNNMNSMGYQTGYQQQFRGQGNINMFTALKKYAQFNGRARRKEFWLFILFQLLVNGGFGIIYAYTTLYGAKTAESIIASTAIVQCIFNFAMIIPTLAVMARRFHDFNTSGGHCSWFIVCGILSSIGTYFKHLSRRDGEVTGTALLTVAVIIFFILLLSLMTPSDPEDNEYGPDSY